MRQLLIWILGSVTLFGSVSASAMGRSEDPRDAVQPVGTDADPSIRQNDERLRQLLSQPGGADPKAPEDRMPLPAAADPADHR